MWRRSVVPFLGLEEKIEAEFCKIFLTSQPWPGKKQER